MNPTGCQPLVMVDDERAYVEFLAAMLTEHLRRPVFTFTRPLDALAALPDLRPGLIVTDYCMPQLNGFEFITQASPLLPEVPFILITGHLMELTPADLSRFARLRTALEKPFGWRQLAVEVERHWPGPGPAVLPSPPNAATLAT